MFWVCVETMRNAHRLVGNPEGKAPLDRRGTACTRNSWTYVRTRPGDGPSVSSWQAAQEHSVPRLNKKTGSDETFTPSCIPWDAIEFSTSICVHQTASFSVIGLTKKKCAKNEVFSTTRRHTGTAEIQQLHAFLTSALDGGEWSASRSSRFIPVERTLVPTKQGMRWDPQPVSTFWRRGRQRFYKIRQICKLNPGHSFENVNSD